MKIIWSTRALKDIDLILDYYSSVATWKVAAEITNRIYARAGQLIDFPLSGPRQFIRNRSKKGLRYLVEGNYKIIYRIVENEIHIETIFDTRQNPKKMNL